MLKKERELYIGTILLTFIFVSLFTSLVFAEEVPLLIEKDIVLQNSCELKDVNEETHIFPKNDSPSVFLGICVLVEALEQGFINELKLTNDPNLGLYVQSISNIEPGSTEFWGLWQNNEFADCGIACLIISEGDIISLILTDWMTETESTKFIFHITELVSSVDTIPPAISLTGASTIDLKIGDTYIELGATAIDNVDASILVVISGLVDTFTVGTYTIHYNASDTTGNNSTEVTRTVNITSSNTDGSSDGGNTLPSFSISEAVAYLKSTQNGNGSFGDSLLYTDWAGIALGAMDVTDSSKTSLLSYFNSHNEISSLLTDNERRAISLLSLGQNPYSFNGINYIKNITDNFDDTQFGDTNLVNDDIFALIALGSSGYTRRDEIIAKDIAFIISEQKTNGSWEESVDITAAAIQALETFKSVSGVSDSLSKATDYLIDKQNSDGGWGNVSSTSWVIQAESALSASWKKNGKSGLDYLATQQASDGAVSPLSETLVNRIWATSYAIAAVSGNSWNEIMQSVSKPETENDSSGSSDDNSDDNNASETINPQTPPEPVICPTGDLFNITTGKACTEFIPKIEPKNPPIEKNNISVNPRLAAKKIKQDSPENTEIAKTDANTLIATAIKALPNKNTSQTLPIVLGTVSGIVLLYSLTKKFLIK